MQTSLTQNVLGCIISLLFLSSCATDTSTVPIKPLSIVLQKPDPLALRAVEWKVITADNAKNILEADIVLFGLTIKNYENLALNMNDVRTYLEQQQNIINTYEKVYNENN